MIAISELKKGIEYCSDNGKRLNDDANFLQKNKKFSSAIPLYIIAYEEIGKAVFLEDKLYKNEEVSNKEYAEFFSRASHLKKIKVEYQLKKETIEQMSDREFEESKRHILSKKELVWWKTSKKVALLVVEDALLLLTKFNELKKKFLYVDYMNDNWLTEYNRFSKRMLGDLCTFLYTVINESYVRLRFIMDMESIGFHQRGPEPNSEDERKMLQNPNLIYMEQIAKMYETSKWLKTRANAVRVIKSIGIS